MTRSTVLSAWTRCWGSRYAVRGWPLYRRMRWLTRYQAYSSLPMRAGSKRTFRTGARCARQSLCRASATQRKRRRVPCSLPGTSVPADNISNKHNVLGTSGPGARRLHSRAAAFTDAAGQVSGPGRLDSPTSIRIVIDQPCSRSPCYGKHLLRTDSCRAWAPHCLHKAISAHRANSGWNGHWAQQLRGTPGRLPVHCTSVLSLGSIDHQHHVLNL